MTEPPIVLAAYGTLRRGERNAGFLASATFLGVGSVPGRLHEMARPDRRPYPYPALMADDRGSVIVELYALPDRASLAAADALEAFDPADEVGSEYVRRRLPVTGGPVAAAWVYLYNGPPDQIGAEIPGGDWVAHRASRG